MVVRVVVGIVVVSVVRSGVVVCVVVSVVLGMVVVGVVVSVVVRVVRGGVAVAVAVSVDVGTVVVPVVVSVDVIVVVGCRYAKHRDARQCGLWVGSSGPATMATALCSSQVVNRGLYSTERQPVSAVPNRALW